MSTRITNDRHTVALYDSVTGIAFGQVFDNTDDAEAFLLWLAEADGNDPRSMHPADLARLREEWGEIQEAVS